MSFPRPGSAALEHARLLPLPVALALAGALVVLLLAPGEADVELGLAAAPVEPGGDQGVALALDRAGEAIDLAPVQQELAGAGGVGSDVGRCFKST